MSLVPFPSLRRTGRPLGAALLALLFALACRLPAAAQVKLELTPGFDNNYRPESWNPLLVRVTGATTSAAAQLQVVVRRARGGVETYAQPLRLNASGSQQRTVYYYHPGLTDNPEVVAQLLVDGRVVAEKKLDNGLQIPAGQPAVIALTQDQGGLNFLSGVDLRYDHPDAEMRRYQMQNGNTPGMAGTNGGGGLSGVRRTNNRVLYPRAEMLPDNANGYEGIDAVMLGDLPLDRLTEEQWAAVTTWVRDGGILVVSGGTDVSRLRGKQLADLLPIHAEGVRQVRSLAGLAYQYETAPKAASTAVVTGALKSDALALCRQGDLPLVVERRHGNGLVVFTAFDLTAPEFRAWPGQGPLWREIMQRGGNAIRVTETVRNTTHPVSFNNGFGDYGGGNDRLSDALAGVQSTEAPSFTSIGIFLLVYILILVPGNYLVLRRWDRKELAWITIPAIIALFSAGAYAVGYKIKGGQLYMHYCSVLEGAANADGFDAYSVASIFSPRQARYDLSVADPAALAAEVTEGANGGMRQAGDLRVERDQKTTVKNALVNMWDHRNFDFESHLDLGGAVSASLVPGGDGSTRATVANGTPHVIVEGVIHYQGSVTIVGTLKPGESKTVKLTGRGQTGVGLVIPGNSSEGTTAASRKIKEALAAVASAPSWQEPNGEPRRQQALFTGWFSGPVAGFALEGETPQMEGINLLVVHLPPAAAVSGGGASSPTSTTPPPARPDPFAGSGARRAVPVNPVAAGAPLVKLSAGQTVPAVPTTGSGSRRVLQPVGNSGGWYLISQQWSHGSGGSFTRSSTTYIAPGQPLPK